MASQPVVFYYRHGCHLCEEMAAVLHQGWPKQTAALVWRDVDSEPAWRERFGTRVPVLTCGDELVCELEPDLQRLADYFGEPPFSL